jgi:Putative Actinobacterial Holin-X, holin superfamily III
VSDVNHPGGEPADLGDESVSDLVQRASRQTAELIRQEIRLAQVELKDKGQKIGMGAGLVGAGALVAFYGGATLVGAAVLGLATALEPWLAALIVGTTLVVIGGILALVGRRKAAEAFPPTPEEAMASVHDDLQHIKEQTGR